MISAGHHSMMDVDGAPTPPAPAYDSLVEYIQGDGNAFIQFPDVLGLVGKLCQLNTLPEFAVTIGIYGFQRESTGSSNGTGFAMSSSRARFIISRSPTASQHGVIVWAGNTVLSKSTYPNPLSVGFSVVGSGRDAVAYNIVDGNVTATTATLSYAQYLAEPRLFSSGNTNENGWTSSSLVGKELQVSYLKIENAIGLVLDAVPCRIGTVGYMYDKISKKRFGNAANSGALLFGNDIIG